MKFKGDLLVERRTNRRYHTMAAVQNPNDRRTAGRKNKEL